MEKELEKKKEQVGGPFGLERSKKCELQLVERKVHAKRNYASCEKKMN